MKTKIEIIEEKESPFGNTYGGLHIVKSKSGAMYLEMNDYNGADYFGPLSETEIKAFEILCKVNDIGFRKNNYEFRGFYEEEDE